MTQLKTIARILSTEGKIDNFRAIGERISLRLGARVWDLKSKGWEIKTEELHNKNTVYHLVSKPEPKQELLVN
jgi:hypothetical protein